MCLIKEGELQQRQLLHIPTHDRPVEDKALETGWWGEWPGGSLLAGRKMDSILTVSSGDKAGVCEVLLCSSVRSQGMMLPCLSAIFSVRRKDGCITVERERHWSRRRWVILLLLEKVEQPGTLRRVGGEAAGRKPVGRWAPRTTGRSPLGSQPLHGRLWAWHWLPPSPYLEGSRTWNSSSCQACRCCWLGAPSGGRDVLGLSPGGGRGWRPLGAQATWLPCIELVSPGGPCPME